MRYLIVIADNEPFFTNWFEPEKHFTHGMSVIDVHNNLYYDGHGWVEIQEDHL